MPGKYPDGPSFIFLRLILFTFVTFILTPCNSQDLVDNSPDKTCVIDSISIHGNKITKTSIILRELPFKAGDTILLAQLSQQLDHAEENLLNTSLFNFATVTADNIGKLIMVKIELIERWYIWPAPIFEITDRNLNSWWASQDFTRVNYGFRIKWSNFRGRMENLDLFLRFGKNHQYSLIYDLPYVNRAKTLGIGFETGYVRKREVGYTTENDKLVFHFDKAYLIHQRYAAIRLNYRRNFYASHQLELRYQHLEFSDSLLYYNPEYFYPDRHSTDFLNLYYKLKLDHRDAKYYPLAGWYFDLELNKAGLGSKFENPVNVFWVHTTSRYYLPLSTRWYFGTSLIGKYSSDNWQPYLLFQGLGYDRDFVRGYEYYVIDGKHYLLSRNNIKFAVIPRRTTTLNIIKTPKFRYIHYASYVSLFADAAYVWLGQKQVTQSNTLPETFLIGAGIGIDMVTYYDKVVRVEYSFNRKGESGIFIHLIAGI